ncbi:hypothetical protein JNB63_02055 [Microbacterium trichothecenolyticum]|uniref:hypothetical protein n=1 Tax=Microbacterium trichothecenolyticum TaxID=69370 RepID=UPI001C6E9523|nr:hypothetical protein [Microbacterium trichothecenolyticum]MBW9118869.1 hypothetical protein [Microbacterium trichothecenolyticum]
MTEQTLIERTQWPIRPEDVTADALIIHGARLAMGWSANSHELAEVAFAQDRESPTYKPAMRAYLDAITGMIAEAQVVIALVDVQKRSPEQAEELARKLWECTEDGGALHELMFDYLDDRGLDAQAIWEEIETLAKTQAEETTTSSVADATIDRVAEAIARTADADYWTTEIAEWEGSEEWEREAHPDNYPAGAYEDREWYRKQARAALEAAAVVS